jgi:hypothetical protein
VIKKRAQTKALHEKLKAYTTEQIEWVLCNNKVSELHLNLSDGINWRCTMMVKEVYIATVSCGSMLKALSVALSRIPDLKLPPT